MEIPRIQIRGKEQYVWKLLPDRLKDQQRVIGIPPEDSDGLDLLALLFRFTPSADTFTLLLLSLNSSDEPSDIVELGRPFRPFIRRNIAKLGLAGLPLLLVVLLGLGW